MFEVILIWLLTAVLALVWGQISLGALDRFFAGPFFHSIWVRFWSGFVFLSFFLGLVCFFTPLTPVVKAVVWGLLVSPLVWDKSLSGALIREIKAAPARLGWSGALLFFLGMGIALLKASGRPEIFDEGAYHLPLIRMWETQGLVPGMANLNGHYGLNSTWHILSAFTNLDFLPFWQPEFALNGLMATVLALYSGRKFNLVVHGSRQISDWMVIFLPFLVFRNLLSSPSTDIPAITATWFILTVWLEALETKASPWSRWPVFVLLPVWVVVLKSSSAALLLVPFWLLWIALKERIYSRGLTVGLVGLAILLPWALQNWLISGYAVFPIRWTSLGSPVWQVPLESIERKFYLAQFGDFAPPDSYTFTWFITWLKAHNPDSRLIILMAFCSLLAGLPAFGFRPAHRLRMNVFLYLTVLAAILSWFLTITEPRYGFGSLVFAALFPVSVLMSWLVWKDNRFRFFAVGILFLMGFNLTKTIREFQPKENFLIWPSSVPGVSFRAVQCGNFKTWSPVSYTEPVPAGKPVFCWDCPFPCVPPEGISDSSRIFRFSWAGRQGFRFQ